MVMALLLSSNSVLDKILGSMLVEMSYMGSDDDTVVIKQEMFVNTHMFCEW